MSSYGQHFKLIAFKKPINDYSLKSYVILTLLIFLGLILRLWGLDNVGLHGDEETTTMAALGILETGKPLFPSGMLYFRSPFHSYLVAISVWLLGHSEWAIRFPSVIAGTLGVLFSFSMGRRFLPSRWNLIFVLIIALNPWMIEWSKISRMYIFLSTSLMLFVIALFKWEEKESYRNLIIAFILFVLALQFHQLAIFSAFLFFFPACTRFSRKMIIQSFVAFFSGLIVFFLFKSIVVSQYSNTFSQMISNSQKIISTFQYLFNNHYDFYFIFIIISIIFITGSLWKQKKVNYDYIITISIWVISLIAALLIEYHISFICYLCFFILSIRSRFSKAQIFLLSALLLIIFSIQFYIVIDASLHPSLKSILKAFIGSCSIYPYLMLINKINYGSILLFISSAYIIKKFVDGFLLPDYFIFFLFSVWMAVFFEGFFRWYSDQRFIFHLNPFFILTTITAFYYIKKEILGKRILSRFTDLFVLPLIVVLIFIKPVELLESFNPKCEKSPDHRGAAIFMKQIQLLPNDLILAEDVLQMHYYLGSVDYWVRGFNDAKDFVKNSENKMIDIYTGTSLIGTGDEFESLLLTKNRGVIYLITSGETFDFPELYLSNGLLEILEKYKFNSETIFFGCDKKTKILRFNTIG